jgi:hypothetical protein
MGRHARVVVRRLGAGLGALLLAVAVPVTVAAPSYADAVVVPGPHCPDQAVGGGSYVFTTEEDGVFTDVYRVFGVLGVRFKGVRCAN